MLIIKSDKYPDFIFEGQSVYKAKQAWEAQYCIQTTLTEINDVNRYLVVQGSDAKWILSKVDNRPFTIATIHAVDDTPKPVSAYFWYGDNSINLLHVTEVISVGKSTFICTISRDCENSIRLTDDIAHEFLAHYKAFTASK